MPGMPDGQSTPAGDVGLCEINLAVRAASACDGRVQVLNVNPLPGHRLHVSTSEPQRVVILNRDVIDMCLFPNVRPEKQDKLSFCCAKMVVLSALVKKKKLQASNDVMAHSRGLIGLRTAGWSGDLGR
ncbi:unnamed protein product [Pleuronectes platessa]|uniref:Uncharacterized protein n=1 Tax=Pleuronectes platessa TaxID=8262 RepID=A0A9N7UY39_PLEPL|nr:unnamed protein product [Pleuronectes platessa]